MAGRAQVINDCTQLDRIRDGVDLVKLVGRYVPGLRKSGVQVVGLCPFHKEKTPSFSVHPAKKVWHCHGCSAGGDVFTFLMRIEALSFPEAKARLAAELGLVLYAESRRDWARIQRDRELAGYWRDGLIEIARDLRNVFFGAYHRSRRHILGCASRGECCELAMDVCEFYEERYQALDEKIDVLVAADMSVIVEQWRKRPGVAA
jgi:CHC2-type zinc finger protein